MSILIRRVSTLRLVCTKGNFLCYLRLCLPCGKQWQWHRFRHICHLDVGCCFSCYFSSFSVLCSFIRVVRIASNARPVPTTDGNNINRAGRYSIFELVV